MGLHHDTAYADDSAYFDYAHGYRFTGASSTQWRTIMAYPPGTRIPYFSNPDLSYDGVALGTSASEDNARALATTGPLVATFRNEAGSPSPTPTPTIGEPADISLDYAVINDMLYINATVKDADGNSISNKKVTIKKYKKTKGKYKKKGTEYTNSAGVAQFALPVKKGKYKAKCDSLKVKLKLKKSDVSS